MAKRKYSDETKAAVMAALLAGQSPTAIGKEYDIPPSTVRSWKANIDLSNAVGHEKKEQVGEKLLVLLNKMADAQIAMLEVLAERNYLRKQDVAELATAFGITDDKRHRITGMLANAAND